MRAGFPSRRQIGLALLPILVIACGGPRPAAPAAAGSSAQATGEAVVRIGDASVRASVVQTSMLPESVARQYGIARSAKTVLLLVAVRRGPEATATAVPARVTATVTDLRGSRQPVAMRELRADGLVDYSIVETTLPIDRRCSPPAVPVTTTWSSDMTIAVSAKFTVTDPSPGTSTARFEEAKPSIRAVSACRPEGASAMV